MLRDEIDALIAAGNATAARRKLEQAWREAPSLATAAFVVSRFESLRPHLSLVPCRLAILRSFTVEPVVPLLRALAFAGGIDLNIRIGEFNAYAQEILDAASWLYRFLPDAVILAVQSRDLLPRLWDSGDETGPDEAVAAADDAGKLLQHLVLTFRRLSASPLIVHALELPPTAGGESASASPAAKNLPHLIGKINAGLKATARESKSVYVLDYNRLINRAGGAEKWLDERKWTSARMPFAAGSLIHLAREWMQFLHPIAGRICKVLAVDLDNTLWAGVIGEEGIEQIRIGTGERPGQPFLALQQALLELRERGILLAVCSKNNQAEAMDALSNHPGMLLRPSHFSAIRINWRDKAENLRDIAAELNVGIDSIAFLDDNPAERDWVRLQIPEVTVIDLPDDPNQFAQIVGESPVLQRLELTAEDQRRGGLYAEQALRQQAQAAAPTLEEFYVSLKMRARVERVKDATLSRAAQLTQKTNQFNLTTQRHTQADLSRMLAGGTLGLTLQVVDRFGDNGIVGLTLLRFHEQVCGIDLFLLSCRVIGRTIESAFLAAVVNEARRRGATRIVGSFMPTAKNSPAADFYPRHGFIQTRKNEDATLWELDLTSQTVAVPSWIGLEQPTV